MEQKPLEILTETQAREREIEIADVRQRIMSGVGNLMPKYARLIDYTVEARPEAPWHYKQD